MIDEWLQAITLREGGFFALTIVCLFAIGYAVRWIATHLIIPARDRLFGHLDVVNDSMRAQTTAIHGLVTSIDRLHERDDEQCVTLRQISTCLQEQSRLLTRIDERQEEGTRILRHLHGPHPP